MPNSKSRIGERGDAARLRSFDLRARFDGRPLLLTKPGSVNWITGGLSDPIDITAPSDPVWVVETESGRALITSQIEAPRIANDFDLAALGWDVIGVPWFEVNAPIYAAIRFAGRAHKDFISDHDAFGENIVTDVVEARMVLSSAEQDDLRSLGSLVGKALGDGINNWRPGESTDFEIASVIGAELEHYGAKAVCLIVGGDNRLRSFRHPLAIGATIDEAVMAVVVARRGGLHVAATRIAVSSQSDSIIRLTKELIPVHCAVLNATLPSASWGDAVDALADGYASIGRPGSWREHFQGGPIAFEQREFELAPGQITSPYWDVAIAAGTAVAWNPSSRGGAKIEETYLVGDDTLELVTTTDGWPMSSDDDGFSHSQVKIIE